MSELDPNRKKLVDDARQWAKDNPIGDALVKDLFPGFASFVDSLDDTEKPLDKT